MAGCSPAGPASVSPARLSSDTKASVRKAVCSERRTVALHSVSRKGADHAEKNQKNAKLISRELIILFLLKNSGVLLCNGDLILSYATSAATFNVSAYGSSDYSIFPHMQMLLNGALAGEWDVTGSSQTYTADSVFYYFSDHLGSSNVVTNRRVAYPKFFRI